MKTKDRRWYDTHFETQKALKLLENLSDEEKEVLSDSLISIIKEIKDCHRNDYDDATKEVPIVSGLRELWACTFLQITDVGMIKMMA